MSSIGGLGGPNPNQPIQPPTAPTSGDQAHVSENQQAQSNVQGQSDSPSTFAGHLAAGSQAHVNHFYNTMIETFGPTLGRLVADDVMKEVQGKDYTGKPISQITQEKLSERREQFMQTDGTALEGIDPASIDTIAALEAQYKPGGATIAQYGNFDAIKLAFDFIQLEQAGKFTRDRIQGAAADVKVEQILADLDKIQADQIQDSSERSGPRVRDPNRNI